MVGCRRAASACTTKTVAGAHPQAARRPPRGQRRAASSAVVREWQSPTRRPTRARRALSVFASATAQASSSASPPEIESLRDCIADFESCATVEARNAKIVEYSKFLANAPVDLRVRDNQVLGCTAQVWARVEVTDDNVVVVEADSDAQLTRGLCAIIVKSLSGASAEQVLSVTAGDILRWFDLGPQILAKSRSNGLRNLIEAIQRRTRSAIEGADPFPSLSISRNSAVPQGEYATAQAKYLNPDEEMTKKLVSLLKEKKVGVVAHYYMDPEVQGVLTKAADEWEHIQISDSLVMADRAVKMVEQGCDIVLVLGVDFMAENVRAVLSGAGHSKTRVYRMAADDIGCTLAEAAENDEYYSFLSTGASESEKSLHVVYINTSLRTKGRANSEMPTITCTSSNVVSTVLQAYAEVPGLHVYYGPDSYMGANIRSLFQTLSQGELADVQALHPAHTPESLKDLLPRFHFYENGACLVHDLFGSDVTRRVREYYGDAYLAAHFEVPGEMFDMAIEAKSRNMVRPVVVDFLPAWRSLGPRTEVR